MPTSFRPDAVLKDKLNDLWDNAISHNTRVAYRTGLQCLVTFLTMSGVIFRLPDLPDISEDMLIYFITHCHSSLHLKWTTIKLYLAGIRFHYLRAGRHNPLCNADRLQCVIRGIKRSQVNISKPRLPIDVNILYKMCNLLRKGVYSPVLDKTLECMCLLAFFGLLRCSEFTVRSIKSCTSYLKICDIVFCKDKSMFTFSFKNDLLCPVSCMYPFLISVRRQPFLSSAPLFVDTYNQPFSRELFISYLRDILNRLGYDKDAFCGHSFRKGFASSMSSAGIQDNLIKTLGRWNSSCYTRYISVPDDTLRDAQRKTIMHNLKLMS